MLMGKNDKEKDKMKSRGVTLLELMITLVVLGPVTAVAFGLAENVAQLGRGINNLVNSGLPDAPEAAQHQAADVCLHPVRAMHIGLRHGANRQSAGQSAGLGAG